MSNSISTVARGPLGITAGPHNGLKTTITSNISGSSGQILSTSLNSGFSFAPPSNNIKAGTITIKGNGSEEAEFDASFINDLKLLLEVINELPDEHPLGSLKHDMRMRRAFNILGG